jgi:signal peptidase
MTSERGAEWIEVGIVFLVLFSILGGIWAYSGQPFPGTSPLAVVESGSMIHEDSPFGRVGTIDPGDIIIVKQFSSIKTWIEEKEADGKKTYKDYGEVVIYYPNGNRQATPVIHRAICWVQIDENGYTISQLGIYNESSLTVSELGLNRYMPSHSGYLTKGDNNPDVDQSNGICYQPVKEEWLLGKAKGEIPWIGMLKLIFSGHPTFGYPSGWVKIGRAVAPIDIWVCFSLLLGAIIVFPFILDYLLKLK